MGYGLGDLSASLLGYDAPKKVPAGSIGSQFNDIFLAQYFFPQLFEYLNAASIIPGETGSLKQFTKSGKDIPTGVSDIDFGALSAALPGIKQKASQQQALNFQQTYDTFSKIPALESLFKQAGGDVDSTGALAKIFGDLSGAALGSVANTGFLSDPVKQGNTLGPLALQKYQIEQSIKQNAQAQALGMVGAGGLSSAGLFGQSGVGVSPFAGSSFDIGSAFAGLNANIGIQNMNAWNQYQQAGLNAQMQGFSMMFGGANGGLSGTGGGG